MTVNDIKTLFAFNRWANARTFKAVESVPEEKLYIDLKDSFGGIHATLVHYCGAEDIWLQRFTGVDPTVYMTKDAYPDYASVKAKLSQVEEGFRTYLETLREDELSRIFVITTQKGDRVSQAVGEALQHLVNHSSYHRGQITTMLRQMGGTPVGTDLIAYYRQLR